MLGMDRDAYRAMRLPHLLAKGISEEAAEFIVDLERCDTEGLARSLCELALEPAYRGRRVRLAGSGRWLEHDGTAWRLI